LSKVVAVELILKKVLLDTQAGAAIRVDMPAADSTDRPFCDSAEATVLFKSARVRLMLAS
jgi:hypothetical protein